MNQGAPPRQAEQRQWIILLLSSSSGCVPCPLRARTECTPSMFSHCEGPQPGNSLKYEKGRSYTVAIEKRNIRKYICYIYIYIYTHDYVHSFIPTYIHNYMHNYVYILRLTYIISYTYIQSYIHTYLWPTYKYNHNRQYICTYIVHPMVYIRIRTYIHAYMHIAYLWPAYIHSYVHTYVHSSWEWREARPMALACMWAREIVFIIGEHADLRWPTGLISVNIRVGGVIRGKWLLQVGICASAE